MHFHRRTCIRAMPSTCAFASFPPLSCPSTFRTSRNSSLRCCVQAPPAPSDESVLLAASRAYINSDTERPPAAAVSAALRSIAVRRRSSTDTSEYAPSSVLDGRWRLIFSASKRTGLFRDLYFPVHVRASWGDDRFVNSVLFGPIEFQLSGPCRWVDKHSRLEFTFCDALLKLGSLQWSFNDLDKDGSTLEGRTVKTLPFFTFVFVNQHLAAARGRSGGLAVWYREE